MADYRQETLNLEKVIPDTDVSTVIETVYQALVAKGYNPISQIVGYVISGDPTYITGYMSARSLIQKVERDEIIEELTKFYVDNKLKNS